MGRPEHDRFARRRARLLVLLVAAACGEKRRGKREPERGSAAAPQDLTARDASLELQLERIPILHFAPSQRDCGRSP
jgi:hypothetical protein